MARGLIHFQAFRHPVLTRIKAASPAEWPDPEFLVRRRKRKNFDPLRGKIFDLPLLVLPYPNNARPQYKPPLII